VVAEQAKFLEELNVSEQHGVKKLAFVAPGAIASGVLRQLLKIKTPAMPYEIFTKSDDAWAYVSK
jgi:hypothetical protein